MPDNAELSNRAENNERSTERKIEGVEPKILKERAEIILSHLGYKTVADDAGRLPRGLDLPADERHQLPQLKQGEEKDEKALYEEIKNDRQLLESEQQSGGLNFAKMMQYNHARFALTSSIFRASREMQDGEKDGLSLPEFDENLTAVTGDFDDETIYDFLITIRRYASYAEALPEKVRDSRMRFWEEIAFKKLEAIEQVATLYAEVGNLRLWKTYESRSAESAGNLKKYLPTTVENLVKLLGQQKDGKNVLTVKVWNPENAPGKERIIEKTIVIDESLYTAPGRSEDRNLVEDACRQLLRQMAGEGVSYDLAMPEGIGKSVQEAYKANSLKEMIAKFFGGTIVGKAAQPYVSKPTEVRMAHGMHGKLLNGHLGYLQAEGVPKFNPEKNNRNPVDFEKLAAIQLEMRKLSDAQKENAYYTIGLLAKQTTKLLTPDIQPAAAIPRTTNTTRIAQIAASEQIPLAPENRKGVTVDQPSDNIQAMENLMTVLDDGFSNQLSLVDSVETNIDNFMKNGLVQAIEALHDWKAALSAHSEIIQWAGLNVWAAKLFPGLKTSDAGARELIARMEVELEAIQKDQEDIRQTVTQTREALKKAIADVRAQQQKLRIVVDERRGLLAALAEAKDIHDQDRIRAQIKKNEEAAEAIDIDGGQTVENFLQSFTGAVDASLEIVDAARVGDNFRTARDQIAWGPIAVNLVLYAEWVSGLRGTALVGTVAGKGIGLVARLHGVPNFVVRPISSFSYGAWKFARVATYTPGGIADAVRWSRKGLASSSKIYNWVQSKLPERSVAATTSAVDTTAAAMQGTRAAGQAVDAVADAARAAQELEVAAKNIRTFDELKEVMDTAMKMKKWGTAAELLNTQSKLISAEAKAGNEVAKRLLNISHAVNVGKYAPPIICIAIDAVMFGVNEYDISLAKESGNRGIVDTLEARRTVRIRQGLIGGAMLAAGPYGLAVLPSYIAGGYIADKVTDSAVDWQRRAKDWLGATPQELLTKLKELPVGTTTFSHTMAVGTPLIPRLWKNWDKTSEQVGMEEYEDVEAINKTMRQALLGAYFMKTCEVEVLPTDSEDIKQRKVTEAIQDRIDFVGKMTAGTYDVSNAGAALFTSADSYANLMAMNRTLVRANAESKVIKYLSKTGEEKELDLSILTYAKKKNENSNADTKESLEFFKALREYEQEIAPFKKLMRDQARQAEIEAKMEARRKMQEETAAQNKVNFEKGNREANEKKNPAFQRRSAEVMLPKARRDSFTSVPDLWDRSEQRMTLADQDGKQVVLTYANFTNGPSISAAPQNGRNMPSNMPTFRVEGQNRVVQATPETLNGGADAALLREALITPIDGRSEESLSKVLNVFPFDVIVSGKRTSTSRGTLLRTLLPMYEKMKTPSEQRFFLNELLQQLRSYKGGLTWEASRKITLKFQDPTYQKVLGIKE